MICSLANSLWLAGCAPEYARFRFAAHRVAQEQEAVLRRILSENADTDFGREHGFSSTFSVAEYQRRVPVRDYSEHLPWIECAMDGASGVLTRDPILLFEPTGGSSGATKLIPYTLALQREFQRGIRAWIANLFSHLPELLGGPAYWSVSPFNPIHERTRGGIAIGFDDDTSYVGGWQNRLVRAVMAVPAGVRTIADRDEFFYATLFHLVRARELRLISIWHPSYLSLMLCRLAEWGGRICFDLAHGNLCSADARRAREVREALGCDPGPETYARLWPKLKLISCWKDANAAAPAERLAALFPHCRVQGKGLIATEAFVSLPLLDREGAALAIRSHFFEFFAGGDDRPQLAHQLERGGRYNVVVTTGGGLYRYRLGDRIEVSGYLGECPLVQFVGREQYVSDWFGEKLTDAHVTQVMRQAFGDLGMTPDFSMVACEVESSPGYVLFLESDDAGEKVQRAAAQIEAGLRANFHYDCARRLGQLACLRAVRVKNGAALYLEEAARKGRKMGGVKPPALDRDCGWSKILAPAERDKI
jgi:hypothetical protein